MDEQYQCNDKDPSCLIAAAIIIARNKTPFLHQGRHVQLGLDCVGLIKGAGELAGISIVDDITYGMAPDPPRFEEAMSKNAYLVDESKPGDILEFRIGRNGVHVGFDIGNGEMIHSYQSLGRVARHDISDKWRNRIIKIWRLKAFGDDCTSSAR